MVAEQLAARGIHNRRVLDAMAAVPRERFVPPAWRADAYQDAPLPIGRGQTISQPYVVAFMAQALALRGGERVLEVGSGSGYAAAVLSHLAAEVYGIELEPELHARSVATLAELGYANVELRRGDGFQGWPELAPFDAIVLSCAIEELPEPLWTQLASRGTGGLSEGARGCGASARRRDEDLARSARGAARAGAVRSLAPRALTGVRQALWESKKRANAASMPVTWSCSQRER